MWLSVIVTAALNNLAEEQWSAWLLVIRKAVASRLKVLHREGENLRLQKAEMTENLNEEEGAADLVVSASSSYKADKQGSSVQILARLAPEDSTEKNSPNIPKGQNNSLIDQETLDLINGIDPDLVDKYGVEMALKVELQMLLLKVSLMIKSKQHHQV